MAKLVRPDPKVAAGVRLLIEKSSLAEAARQLDLAEGTTARVAAGLQITTGTELVAKAGLAKVGREAA